MAPNPDPDTAPGPAPDPALDSAFLSLVFKVPTKKVFLSQIFCLLCFKGKFTSVFIDDKVVLKVYL